MCEASRGSAQRDLPSPGINSGSSEKKPLRSLFLLENPQVEKKQRMIMPIVQDAEPQLDSIGYKYQADGGRPRNSSRSTASRSYHIKHGYTPKAAAKPRIGRTHASNRKHGRPAQLLVGKLCTPRANGRSSGWRPGGTSPAEAFRRGTNHSNESTRLRKQCGRIMARICCGLVRKIKGPATRLS